jgi:hypothetical protein
LETLSVAKLSNEPLKDIIVWWNFDVWWGLIFSTIEDSHKHLVV